MKLLIDKKNYPDAANWIHVPDYAGSIHYFVSYFNRISKISFGYELNGELNSIDVLNFLERNLYLNRLTGNPELLTHEQDPEKREQLEEKIRTITHLLGEK